MSKNLVQKFDPNKQIIGVHLELPASLSGIISKKFTAFQEEMPPDETQSVENEIDTEVDPIIPRPEDYIFADFRFLSAALIEGYWIPSFLWKVTCSGVPPSGEIFQMLKMSSRSDMK